MRRYLRGRSPEPRLTPEPAPIVGARWIPLTKGLFALVDEADFVSLARFNWFAHTPKGKRPMACRFVFETKKRVLMHREIMNAPDGIQVDHRNLNDLDNRRDNLRFATNQQNHANRPAQRNNTSGFKGVTKGGVNREYRRSGSGKQMWLARITVDQKSIHLGSFRDPIEAACAYNVAAMKHFGEYARLNRMD